MPLIPDQPKMETERIACQMECGIAASLRAYAQWRGWKRDWAINRLLEYAFTCERDFQRWQQAQRRRGGNESSASPHSAGEQS